MQLLFTAMGCNALCSVPCVQDEKYDKSAGPSIEDLVAKETVDILGYMGWQQKSYVKVEMVSSHFSIPSFVVV